jgi:hypothetical protein
MARAWFELLPSGAMYEIKIDQDIELVDLESGKEKDD